MLADLQAPAAAVAMDSVAIIGTGALAQGLAALALRSGACYGRQVGPAAARDRTPGVHAGIIPPALGCHLISTLPALPAPPGRSALAAGSSSAAPSGAWRTWREWTWSAWPRP